MKFSIVGAMYAFSFHRAQGDYDFYYVQLLYMPQLIIQCPFHLANVPDFAGVFNLKLHFISKPAAKTEFSICTIYSLALS